MSIIQVHLLTHRQRLVRALEETQFISILTLTAAVVAEW